MGKEAWIEKLRAEGNTKLSAQPREKPQEPTPVLYSDLIWIWSAYCFLSERRGVGPAGPIPITVEAMDAYSRLTNRRERIYLDQLMMFIPALDRAYLKDFYDRQAKEMAKSNKTQAPSNRGGINRAPPTRKR